jgi:cytochrome c biogenesis protein CcdA
VRAMPVYTLLLCAALASVAYATPPTVDTPTTESTATATDTAPMTHKVVVLPLTFTVYQGSVGAGIEAVPDWTADARRNLEAAAGTVLKAHGDFDVTALPTLSDDENAVLHEELGVVHQIIASGATFAHGEWHKHPENFDPVIGDGLNFLHEKTGADYAVVIDGIQIKQSGGQIFMQIALAAAGVAVVGGAGATVSMAIIDLNHQTVHWFNSSIGVEALGISSMDVRTPDSAQKVITALLKNYPTVTALASAADAHVLSH